MRLDISQIYGTSSNHKLNFDVSENYVAYIASGGVIVCTIDPLEKKLVNQRFFCANASQSIQDMNGPSSANAYLNLYMNSSTNGNGQREEELDKDEFEYPKLVQPIVINPSGSQPAGSLSELSISPPKHYSPSLSGSLSGSFNGSLASQNKIQQISSIAISPDEKLLAVGESGTNPRILIFSLASDSLRCPMISIHEHNFGIQCLRFSKDSRHLVSFGDDHDGFVYIWKIQGSGTKIVALNKNSTKLNGCFGDYDNEVILSYGLRSIKIWKFEDLKANGTGSRKEKIQVRNVILGDHLNANFIDMVKLGENYLVMTQRNELLEVNMDSCSLELLQFRPTNVTAFSVAGDQLYFNEGANIESLPLSKLDSRNTKPDTPTESSEFSVVSMCAFNQNLLVYLTDTEEVRLYDTRTQKSTDLLRKANVQGLKRTVHGLYTWNRLGEVRRFNDGQLLVTVDLEEESKMAQNSIACLDSTLNNEVIVGDSCGRVLFYDAAGEFQNSLTVHEFSVNDLCYFQLNSKEYLVTAGRDRMVQILFREEASEGAASWELLQTLSIHKSNVTSLIVHEDRIVTGSTDRTVAVHRITPSNRIELVKIITLKFTPLSIAVSDDDELILSLLDKSLQIYHSHSFELKKSFKFDLNIDNIVKYKGFIICSSANKSLQIINPANGSCLYRTWGHSDSIRHLILTDDGAGLISLSQGCLFAWNIDISDDLDPKLFSSTTPIINRKIARNNSPIRAVSPSKFQTPSKLSSTVKPSLTPLDRRTPSASSTASNTPLGSTSPSLRSRQTSSLRSLSPTATRQSSLIPTSTPLRNSSSTAETKSTRTTGNALSNGSIGSQINSRTSSTLRPNGLKPVTNNTVSNKENIVTEQSQSQVSKIGQLLSLLKSVELNQDSYTVGEMKKLKEGVKFLFEAEETLLENYNDLLLKSLKEKDANVL
ncbi:hypothetical protein WICPIJ_006358 [Wickerhamomyces pijperi]|uniref:WD40 repeat-like protein n=1 Tax=Wickerhamomyces pijperi TaxID=599730 RepID=A0A9P8Q4J6_WICPI|nr:hypothetical protein WICPIJ_006358 [Wickerhamomyces pijperi]